MSYEENDKKDEDRFARFGNKRFPLIRLVHKHSDIFQRSIFTESDPANRLLGLKRLHKHRQLRRK